MAVDIILDGDDELKDWADLERIYAHEGRDEIRAVYLKNGTADGMPACFLAARVAGAFDDEDAVILIEMTARMFNSIAGAFRGRADFEGTPL
jgi:hypothetical protein